MDKNKIFAYCESIVISIVGIIAVILNGNILFWYLWIMLGGLYIVYRDRIQKLGLSFPKSNWPAIIFLVITLASITLNYINRWEGYYQGCERFKKIDYLNKLCNQVLKNE